MESPDDARGTYAAFKLSDESKKQIKQIQKAVKNPVPVDKLHVTLLYSRKEMVGLTDNDVKAYQEVPATVAEWDIFPTQDGKRAMVLKLDAPALVHLHKEFMEKYKGTYDHDEYIPHITISYDIGEGNLRMTRNVFKGMKLTLVAPYIEDLDLNWKSE
jgi:2'-5' RNA ligase